MLGSVLNELIQEQVCSSCRPVISVWRIHMLLKGKTALIAGAGRNCGKTIALTFAREKADLILLARTAREVEQVARECEQLGVNALPVTADVSKHEQVNRAVEQGLDRFGKVDALVSVAAIRPHKNFWEYDYD